MSASVSGNLYIYHTKHPAIFNKCYYRFFMAPEPPAFCRVAATWKFIAMLLCLTDIFSINAFHSPGCLLYLHLDVFNIIQVMDFFLSSSVYFAAI